jgi:hypothetical protein
MGKYTENDCTCCKYHGTTHVVDVIYLAFLIMKIANVGDVGKWDWWIFSVSIFIIPIFKVIVEKLRTF